MTSEACMRLIIASRHLVHLPRCRKCRGVAVDFNIVSVLIWYSMTIVGCMLKHSLWMVIC